MYLPHVCKLSITCKQLPHIEVKESGCVEFCYVKALHVWRFGEITVNDVKFCQ